MMQTPHDPKDQDTAIEVLARGLCVLDGLMLLCRNRHVGNRYLPGGHVEFGESARSALERELFEELGLHAATGTFLGVCEHAFRQSGRPHAEINLVFQVTVEGLQAGRTPEPRESWLAFEWWPLQTIEASGIEPASLRPFLSSWSEKTSEASLGFIGMPQDAAFESESDC